MAEPFTQTPERRKDVQDMAPATDQLPQIRRLTKANLAKRWLTKINADNAEIGPGTVLGSATVYRTIFGEFAAIVPQSGAGSNQFEQTFVGFW